MFRRSSRQRSASKECTELARILPGCSLKSRDVIPGLPNYNSAQQLSPSAWKVSQNTAKHAHYGSQNALVSADSRNTPKNSVFFNDAHADTNTLAVAVATVFLERERTCWPYHCSSYRVAAKSSGRATEHILHCCCR